MMPVCSYDIFNYAKTLSIIKKKNTHSTDTAHQYTGALSEIKKNMLTCDHKKSNKDRFNSEKKI